MIDTLATLSEAELKILHRLEDLHVLDRVDGDPPKWTLQRQGIDGEAAFSLLVKRMITPVSGDGLRAIFRMTPEGEQALSRLAYNCAHGLRKLNPGEVQTGCLSNYDEEFAAEFTA